MIKVQSINLDTVVAQGKKTIVSNMNGETVMMSIDNGKYYNLGEIGGVIWNSLTEPVSVNDLIQRLLSEYDVEQEDCERQVTAFLEKLAKEDIIAISA